MLHIIPVAMSQTQLVTIELEDLSTCPPASILQHNKTSSQDIKDTPHNVESDSSETQDSGEESSLPLVDRGKDAWFFLAACWVVEAITFGKLLNPLGWCISLASLMGTYSSVSEQALVSPLVFSKTTIALMSLSSAQAASLPLVQPLQ